MVLYSTAARGQMENDAATAETAGLCFVQASSADSSPPVEHMQVNTHNTNM